MKIGEKIKKLRTAKLMTQSELAGNEITRNMLSRIENGAANPSLSTVQYLAAKLNVSAGFLLAENEDEALYFKHNEITGIKKTYMSGDYRICRDVCLSAMSLDDDEVRLILSECNLEIGIEEFNAGRLHSACEYFDEAIESCSKTIYNTVHVMAIAAAYFRYMRRVSASLSSNVIEESEIDLYPALTDRFSLYAYRLEKEERRESESLPEDMESGGDIFDLHLSALRLMRSKRFGVAYEKLKKILVGEEPVPMPMLYFVFCDLEACCKECKDFKGAYEYSLTKLDHMQKLLT